MQLSRVDAGVGLRDDDADLIAVLDLVVGDCARGLDEPERIHYVKLIGATLVAGTDMDAFAMAARNLIDNAANQRAVDGPVVVNVESGGVIRVVNDGPAIAP